MCSLLFFIVGFGLCKGRKGRENYDERTNGQNDKYEHASQMQFAPSSTCPLVCLSACASDERDRREFREIRECHLKLPKFSKFPIVPVVPY